jgi:divalent metal cation (Fe/Co/Zn/Cd) transporter
MKQRSSILNRRDLKKTIDLLLIPFCGTTLERAHALAHTLRDAIESELKDAEVLIHVEPETTKRDPATEPKPFRAG